MQSMMLRLILCILLYHTQAQAWDTEPGIPGARLYGYLPSGVHFNQVNVGIKGNAVSVTYQGQYSGRPSRLAALTNYSTVFGWQGVAADYPDQHMPELTFKVNGLLIRDTPRSQAFLDGVDVTNALKKAGIDPLLAGKGEDGLIEAPARAARKLFSNTDGPAFPLWHLSYQHVWTVPRLREGKLTFEVAYQARPAKSAASTLSKQFEAAVLAHCGDPLAVKGAIATRNGITPDSVVLETIVIPLQIANMAANDAYLSVNEDTPSGALPTVAVLACGTSESAISGKQSVNNTMIAYGTTLSVLRIHLQP